MVNRKENKTVVLVIRTATMHVAKILIVKKAQ